MDLILLIFPNTTGVEDASAVSRVITGYLASDIQSLALLQLCVCVCVCVWGGGGGGGGGGGVDSTGCYGDSFKVLWSGDVM